MSDFSEYTDKILEDYLLSGGSYIVKNRGQNPKFILGYSDTNGNAKDSPDLEENELQEFIEGIPSF